MTQFLKYIVSATILTSHFTTVGHGAEIGGLAVLDRLESKKLERAFFYKDIETILDSNDYAYGKKAKKESVKGSSFDILFYSPDSEGSFVHLLPKKNINGKSIQCTYNNQTNSDFFGATKGLIKEVAHGSFLVELRGPRSTKSFASCVSKSVMNTKNGPTDPNPTTKEIQKYFEDVQEDIGLDIVAAVALAKSTLNSEPSRFSTAAKIYDETLFEIAKDRMENLKQKQNYFKADSAKARK